MEARIKESFEVESVGSVTAEPEPVPVPVPVPARVDPASLPEARGGGLDMMGERDYGTIPVIDGDAIAEQERRGMELQGLR